MKPTHAAATCALLFSGLNQVKLRVIGLWFAFGLLSVPAWPSTIYVNAGNSSACPCNTSPPAGCGTSVNPYSCISNAIDDTGLHPGDTIQAQPGTYSECLRIDVSGTPTQPITIRSQTPGSAVIVHPTGNWWSCPPGINNTVYWVSSYVTFDGFKVTSPTPFSVQYGIIFFYESDPNGGVGNIVRNAEIDGHGEAIDVYAAPGITNLALRIEDTIARDSQYAGFHVLGPGVQIIRGESRSNGGDGVKIESHDVVVDGTHIHHNKNQGVLEGGDHNSIRNCEIDNNGIDIRYQHGIYVTGTNGFVQNNRVHHNASYGIQLWQSPQNFIVERNEVFANGAAWTLPDDLECSPTTFTRLKGGGIVLGGGNPAPHNVIVRYNTVHHNIGGGLGYLVDGTDSGNVFHHNTVYANHGGQLSAGNAFGSGSGFKNNIVVGAITPGPFPDHLLDFNGSTPVANVFDGNLYFDLDPGATAQTPLFSWNNTHYSFSQMSNVLFQDQHSTWNGDIRFVDPDVSPLNERGKPSNGDYHLRIDSPAIAGVCCVSGSTGVLDIDGEQVSSCTANCTATGNGIGADFYLDTDADGTANRYDCAPTASNNRKVCDGDAVSDSKEINSCAHPGAAYLASIYPPQGPNPGAPELCDGNDNNCNGLAPGEEDADLDGFFPSCGPTLTRDCNDTDSKIYPGAMEVCDGKVNLCSGSLPPEEIDSDHDGYLSCSAPGFSFDCKPNCCCANPEANEICGNGIDDNCNGAVDEAGCSTSDMGCGCTP